MTMMPTPRILLLLTPLLSVIVAADPVAAPDAGGPVPASDVNAGLDAGADPVAAPNAGVSAPASGFQAGLAIGYRRVDLSWQTAASTSGSAPVAPFTAEWRHVELVESALSLSYGNGPLRLRGEFTYGTAFSGTSRLSGYADDSRQQETYRSQSRSDDGERWAGTGAMGCMLTGAWDMRFTPEVGYTWSRQRFALTDGEQIIPATGPYPGLDSSYQATWQGPFLGLDVALPLGAQWQLQAHAAYRWADYGGKADWNLRSDLTHPDSLVQSAHGDGTAVGLGVAYHPSTHLWWQLDGELEHWQARSGISRTSYLSGAQDETALVSVRSASYAVQAGLRWEF